MDLNISEYGCGIAACGSCTVRVDGQAVRSEKKPKPSDAHIDEAITNICRCGTCQRVRAAIKRVAGVRA